MEGVFSTTCGLHSAIILCMASPKYSRDCEIQTIGLVVESLERLDGDARIRVVEYLSDRYLDGHMKMGFIPEIPRAEDVMARAHERDGVSRLLKAIAEHPDSGQSGIYDVTGDPHRGLHLFKTNRQGSLPKTPTSPEAS